MAKAPRIEEIKARYSITEIVERYVKLTPNGTKPKACCPFHDEKTPSFVVDENKQYFTCYGCGAHGDIFDFVTMIEGVSTVKAKSIITGDHSSEWQSRPKRESVKIDPYEPYTPLPLPDENTIQANRFVEVVNPARDPETSKNTAEIDGVSVAIWKMKPSMVFRYPSGYVLRINMRDGSKITPTVQWCKRGEWVGWVAYHFPASNRQHYGHIKQYGPVLIPEGEKAVDAGAEALRLTDWSAIGYAGGTNAVLQTDWSMLAGRDVYISPDHDDPGAKAAYVLAEHLAESAASVHIVWPPEKSPGGWDIADRKWCDGAELIQYIISHAVEYTKEVPEEYNSEPVIPPAAPIEDDNLARVIEPEIETATIYQTNKFKGDPLNEAIVNFNEDHCIVLNGSQCTAVRQMKDEDGKPEFRFLSISALNTFYENHVIFTEDSEGKMKPTQVSKRWMRDYRRRTFDGVTFDPSGKANPSYLNMWLGYSIEPSEHGRWPRLKRHIFDNICSGDRSLFEYVIAWMADMFQKPTDRPGVLLVLRGEKGTGKSILSDFLRQIIGNHSVHVARPEHLTGKFNSHFANKMFVAIEEGFWAGDKSADGVLKDLITNNKINIERKGVDPIPVRNCLRFLMTTNSEWAVPATKDERRYCVIDVAPNQKQNRKYFGAIAEEMANGGLERMLYDLLNFDLSRVDLNDVPETQALNEQKMEAMSLEERFWYNILKTEYLGLYDEWYDSGEYRTREQKDIYWTDGLFVENKILHSFYITYARNVNARRTKDQSWLSRDLGKFYEPLKNKKRSKQGGRPWGFELGTIDSAREQFEQHMGFKITWDKD